LSVRIGIVGCGAIFRTHADAIGQIDSATLTAVYDEVLERAEAASVQYSCMAARSLDELLDLCDAVIVAVPSGLHSQIGIQAVSAGKHALVEKPLDVTLERASDLVEEAKRAGVKLAGMSQHRFSKSIQRVRQAAQNGELGDLLAGDAYIKWYRTQAYYDSGDWRGTKSLDGGGCLINQGIHMIDMIQWIMGGVASVQAQMRTAAHNVEVEDIAQALVEYRNGATGIIYGSTSFYPGLPERLEVHGRHGSVVVESDCVRLWKADAEAAAEGLYGGGVMMQPTPTLHTASQNEELLIRESAADRSACWGEQHRLQIQDFVDAILEDREPFITGQDALEPLKVVLAIYESAGKWGERIAITA